MMRPAFATAQFPRRRDRDISNEIMGRATRDEATAEKCNYLLPAKRTNDSIHCKHRPASCPAVRAAIILPWSNGQTEGQITRLKLVRRQMYGRGKLDLLQARLIGAQ
jgi:hypothetical protein